MPEPLPEAPNRILIDTNVLVSAFIFGQRAGQVYRHCVERYTVFTSEWILTELQDVISRPKFHLPEKLQFEIVSQIRSDLKIITPTNQLPTDSIDPDDNNVLQAALFVDASFLITGDEKHLLPLKKIGNTEIISPRAFYERYIA